MYTKSNKLAVVTSDRLDTSGTDLAIRIGLVPLPASVTLLGHHEERMVKAFKVDTDRRFVVTRNPLSSLPSESACFISGLHSKPNHDRVRVTVDNLSVVWKAILFTVPLLHECLGQVDHGTSVRRDGTTDGEALHHADMCSCKSVHRVGDDLHR